MRKMYLFCMIIFVLATIVNTGILVVAWFQWKPLAPLLFSLTHQGWFPVFESILLSITAIGLLFILLRTCTTAGKKSQLTLKREKGNIAITQNAISSTVKHVIEKHPGLNADSIQVKITGIRKPRVTINVRIDPGRNGELEHLGIALQNEIATTFSAFIGYPASSIHLTFTGNADIVTPAFIQQAGHNPPESPSFRKTPSRKQTSSNDTPDNKAASSIQSLMRLSRLVARKRNEQKPSITTSTTG